MTWKQPIPVDIPELAGDPFGRTVFQQLLLRCRNEDGYVTRPDGTAIFLKKGQCLVGRYEFAKSLGLNSNQSLKVQRILVRLEKVNRLLNRQQNKQCSIITVLNYDKWVSLEQTNERIMNRLRTDSEQIMNTNKSVKSEKSGRRETLAPETSFSNERKITPLTFDEKRKIALGCDTKFSFVEGTATKAFDYYSHSDKPLKGSLVGTVRSWVLKDKTTDDSLDEFERQHLEDETPEARADRERSNQEASEVFKMLNQKGGKTQ